MEHFTIHIKLVRYNFDFPPHVGEDLYIVDLAWAVQIKKIALHLGFDTVNSGTIETTRYLIYEVEETIKRLQDAGWEHLP